MLYNLQVLRGIAAMGVVLWHTAFSLPGGYHSQLYGVATFFVISGFIMCFITRDRADGFLAKRIIRIVPLYWLCTFALLFLMYRIKLVFPSTWAAPPPSASNSLLVELPRSLFFVPWDRDPILGVGWTLNFEMYFYVVFAFSLWISRKIAPLLAASFVVAVIAAGKVGVGGWVTQFYSDSNVLNFVAGIGVFYVWRSLKSVPRIFAALGAALILLCYGSEFARPWMASGFDLLTLVFPVLIVLGALVMEKSGLKLWWQPLQFLGDASYAIYLTHTIMFEIIRVSIGGPSFPAKDSVPILILYLSGSLLLGIAVHLWIERPLTAYVRKIVASRKGGHLPQNMGNEAAPV